MRYNLADTIDSAASTRLTKDGYLVADVLCARTGIQNYAGWEFGMDQDVVSVYRLESEVFNMQSLSSFVGKPVTDDHPSEFVNADNWNQYAKGQIGEGVLRDGEFVRVPVTLMDGDLVSKVLDGKRQISMGYSMDLDFTEGTTPEGIHYDAIAKDLRMNHLAIVDVARAGSKASIEGLDSKNKWICPIADSTNQSPQSTIEDRKMQLETVTVDGIPVETTPQGAAVVKRLSEDKEKLTADLDKAIADKDTELAAKDTELAAKDAKIADLEKSVLTEDQIEVLIAEKAALLSKAQAICGDADFKGKSNDDIKKMCVAHVRGDDAVKDREPAYIQAAFDLLPDPKDSHKGNDTLKTAFAARVDGKQTVDSQQAYQDRISSAWKQPQQGA